LSCLVLSCLVLSCLVLSCLVLGVFAALPRDRGEWCCVSHGCLQQVSWR
jgi:hypothetical protein